MLVFAYIFVGIICGLITNSMNQNKGYDSGFAWGFFLGIIGIIVVAVRPYNNASSSSVSPNSKSFNDTNQSSRSASMKKEDCTIFYCTNCFNIVSDIKTHSLSCSNCGKPLTNSLIYEPKWESMTEKEKNHTKEQWFGISSKEDFEKQIKEKFKDSGLEKYIQIFEKNDILDPDVAYSINEIDLKEIGIESLGDRKRIIEAIKNTSCFSVKQMEAQEGKKETDDRDWICPKCGSRNKPFYAACSNCNTEKPEEIENYDDWVCPSCSTVNVWMQKRCRNCDRPR